MKTPKSVGQCKQCGIMFTGISTKIFCCARCGSINRRSRYKERELITAKIYRENNKELLSVKWKKYYLSNKEKLKSNYREWKDANPNHWKEYYNRNREKIIEKGRHYNKIHADKKKISTYKWMRNNLDRYKVYTQNRRRLVKINGGELSKDIYKKLFEYQQGKCAICRLELKPLFMKYSCDLDHVIPLSKGGKNIDGNVQLTHPTCNRRKHTAIYV